MPTSLITLQGLGHIVRERFVLPACEYQRDRLDAANRSHSGSKRALKYLTFLDTWALDVLLLYDKRVLPHERPDFSSVVFFPREPQAALHVPRFLFNIQIVAGPFIETILAPSALPPPPQDGATQDQLDLYQSAVVSVEARRQFEGLFPFHVLNLDLTGPREIAAAPEQVLEALRRVFESQGRIGSSVDIKEFTLAITLPIWSAVQAQGLSGTFNNTINENISNYEELALMMDGLLDGRTWAQAAEEVWPLAFQIAFPKCVVNLLRATGWSVDPATEVRFVKREALPDAAESMTMVMGVVRTNDGPYDNSQLTFGYMQALHELFGAEYALVAESDVTTDVRQEINRLRRKIPGMAVTNL